MEIFLNLRTGVLSLSCLSTYSVKKHRTMSIENNISKNNLIYKEGLVNEAAIKI